MKVIASKVGYFGKLRAVGDEFEVPEGVKGSWFHEADKPKAEAKKPKAEAKPAEADLV